MIEELITFSLPWRSTSLKIVVTGGAGFIGSHLCARLLQEGHSVLCVDTMLTGSQKNIAALHNHPQFTFLQFDVTQPFPFPFEADAIFHLASPASPVGYMEHPIETILVNSQGTYQMLEQARRLNALFLMTSTSEVYGDPLVHPQPERLFGATSILLGHALATMRANGSVRRSLWNITGNTRPTYVLCASSIPMAQTASSTMGA